MMTAALAISGCFAAAGAASQPAQAALAMQDRHAAEDYRFIDKADALWEAIGDAPPDYSFAFEGGEPWAWETSDGHWIVVEDEGDGIRSYYFEPGDDAPFLAVEPGHSYGFDAGRLAAVYGPDGGALPPGADDDAVEDAAMALYARGRRLKAAMAPRDWTPVDTGAWIDASPYVLGFVQLWTEARVRYPEWRRHRSVWQAGALQRRLEAERLRRRGLSEQFRRWREGGFQGPPPGRWRRPDPDRPHRPGRGPGRPRPGAGGTVPPLPVPGGGTRPGAGRPGDGRPGTEDGRPSRPIFGRPGRDGGPRGERPDRDAATPSTPGAGIGRRPGWGGRPPGVPVPVPPPVAAPGVDAAVPAAPSRGSWSGGWRRPDRPRPEMPAAGSAPAGNVPSRGSWGGWRRPGGSGTVTAPTAPTAPSSTPVPVSPPRGWGDGWRGGDRPAPSGDAPRFRPRPAPQPGSAAPAAQRPTYTPPAPRAAPPPAAPRAAPPAPPPRPAPPRPAKLGREAPESAD